MADEKSRDWVDTVSKLLIPILIFAASAWFSYQKNQSDAVNQKFQRESEVLKLAASANESERTLGLKTIEILQKQGKFSQEMLPVVQALSQGRPSDVSTQRAQNIIQTAKQDPSLVSQIAAPAKSANTVYIQITKDEQRSDANGLATNLQKAGFEVPGIEFVNPGTQNNYIRYFSEADKTAADKVLQSMTDMGFKAEEQDFSKTNLHGGGGMEVWIGQKQASLQKL